MRLAFWFAATSAVLATAAMIACSSFSGSSTGAGAGDASSGDAASMEGSSPPPNDAGSSPGLDATADAGGDAGCTEIALSGGTANSSTGDTAVVVANGVEIRYAGGPNDTEDAYWEYVIPTPSGSKGLSLEIDCTINSSNKSGDWYANVAGVTNGDYQNGSSVFFVLAGSTTAPTLDVDSFLLGNTSPNAASFVIDNTAILNSANTEKLFLNVEWTTADASAPVSVSLGGADYVPLPGPTLAGGEIIAGTTNLHLGDYASAGTGTLPVTVITFTRACISFH